jgi:hypothetical protein
MNLELRSIIAPGDLKNERLTLRALADLDVGDYLVAQTVLVDGQPTTDFDHMLWFQYEPIAKGDIVVVYTKTGKTTERVLSTGKTAHFFYLDLKSAIWDDPSKGAIVLHTPSWKSKSLSELIKG